MQLTVDLSYLVSDSPCSRLPSHLVSSVKALLFLSPLLQNLHLQLLHQLLLLIIQPYLLLQLQSQHLVRKKSLCHSVCVNDCVCAFVQKQYRKKKIPLTVVLSGESSRQAADVM